MGSLGLLPHGTVAILVIAVLLFAEEAGLPLFFISGDFLLLAAGVLAAAGAVNPWLLVPVVAAAVLTGALATFAWSHLLGADRLHSLANRLHAARHLDRAERRLRAAGAAGILVLRFVPGLRVYSTMVVGALRMELRTFLLGLVPAVVMWVGGFTLLGGLAGGPVEAVVSAIEHYATEAGAGLAAVAATTVTVRHMRHRRGARAVAG
ncbi:MAG TPA: VTT domain-containing protein [Candidatus Binatia bacterium]|nr:VTT domain-containing protein [Candidatus Binatia bacterium]